MTVASGYAAKFDEETVIAGLFREKLARGCFARSLRSDDARALLDHDAGRVLGRVSAGTLSLREDSAGLHFEVDLDATTPEGQTALGTVGRGDMRGMSFGFVVRAEQWIDADDDLPLRIIIEADLIEVSIVAWPAYPTTTAKLVRAKPAARAKPVATPKTPMPKTLLARKMRMEQLIRGIR